MTQTLPSPPPRIHPGHADEGSVASPPEQTRLGFTRRDVLSLVIVAAAAATLRIVLMTTGALTLDSDTAVVYLMAKHVADGDFAIFFWGQGYGGTILQLASGAVMAVIGPSPYVVAAVSVTFDLICGVLVWLLVARARSTAEGIVAAAIFWFAGYPLVHVSLQDPGFYLPSILCALVAATVMTTNWSLRHPLIAWFVFGVAAGLAFWQSIAGAALAAPVLILAITRGRGIGRFAIGAAGVFLGASPWLVNFILSPNAATNTFSPPLAHLGGRVASIVSQMLPSGVWPDGPANVKWAIGVAIAAVLIAAFIISLRHRRWVLVTLIAGAPLVLVSLLLAGSNVGLAERRYDEFLLPAVGAAISVLVGRRAVASAVIAAAAAAGTVIASIGAVSGLEPEQVAGAPFGKDAADVVQVLDERHVSTVWAGYWDAYRITAASNERIIAGSLTFDRYPSYNRDAAGTRTVLVQLGSDDDQKLRHDQDPSQKRQVVDDLVLYQLTSPVDPASLTGG